MSGLQGGVRQDKAMPYKKDNASVLTNQCLGKGTNAEPPGPLGEELRNLY